MPRPIAETFTDRCRRLLTEQPNQPEFTVSRGGLETLVLDSERYAEQNAKSVREHLANEAHREKWRYRSLEEQLDDLRGKWPEASMSEEADQYGRRLLKVPGVRRDRHIWKNDVATVYLLIPNGFPCPQPERFYTSDDDALLEHGGVAKWTFMATDGALVEGLRRWNWRILEPNSRHTLRQHLAVVQHRFAVEHEDELAA